MTRSAPLPRLTTDQRDHRRVLNRLYIVIGIIAILILAAAFIVPSLVPWSNYRGRMETLASRALGADVRINGDIRFSLLPAPHLELTDVAVGPQQAPVMSVKSANADFSLMDFLRDRYSMTRLVLDHPVLDLKVALADGTVRYRPEPSGGRQRRPTFRSPMRRSRWARSMCSMRRRGGNMRSMASMATSSISAIRGPFGFTGGGSRSAASTMVST